MQPDLSRLIEELGLETFGQHEDGDMLLEHSGSQVPDRVAGYRSAPAARRVAGGMEALTEAIRRRLAAGRIVSGCRARRIGHRGDFIEIEAGETPGPGAFCRVEHVLLAVPPRLAAHTIDFAPLLPDALARQWKRHATWMASHAKYVAVFDEAFWREQGLSGEARSSVGPMVEVHDASAHDGHGALFGFLGVPARVRSQVGEADLLAHCRAQLTRLFGGRAGSPRAEFLKDWAIDPFTAVDADRHLDDHQTSGPPCTASSGPWEGRLVGIASEWSPGFSGYAAGAVDAARRGVEALAMPGTTCSWSPSHMRRLR
jgi:monoamine oxidase